MRGSEPIIAKISDAIVLTATLTVTEERFFTTGVKGLVTNVALLLGIPENRVQVAGVGSLNAAKQIVGGRRRLFSQRTGTFPVELVVLEDEEGQLVVSDEGELDRASVDNATSTAEAELMALAETFLNISSDELTNGTKIYVNQTIVQVTPKLKIVGWTCDVDQFNDGLCDCNCCSSDSPHSTNKRRSDQRWLAANSCLWSVCRCVN